MNCLFNKHLGRGKEKPFCSIDFWTLNESLRLVGWIYYAS